LSYKYKHQPEQQNLFLRSVLLLHVLVLVGVLKLVDISKENSTDTAMPANFKIMQHSFSSVDLSNKRY